MVILTRIHVLFNMDTVILGWRETDNASIATNYMLNGFHFFYPQVNWGGNGPGYVEMEFPLIQYLTALLFQIFGVHDGLALIIPLLSALGTIIVLYLFVKRTFDSNVALIAGVFAAISPLFVKLSTSFWVDPSMLFFSVVGLYVFTRWVETNRLSHFLLAAFSVTTAILLKLTALYLGFPLLYLCILKYKQRFLRVPMVWVFATIVLLPPFLWYYHAHLLYQEYNNTFGILSSGMEKFAPLQLLLNPDFYVKIVARISVYFLTPIVFFLALYGFSKFSKSGKQNIFHVWFASVILYMIVAAKGSYVNMQYLLPLLLPGAALASVGLFQLRDRLRISPWFHGSQRKKGLAPNLAFSALFFISILVSHYLFHTRVVAFQGAFYKKARDIGFQVEKNTEEGSLIVVAPTAYVHEQPDQKQTIDLNLQPYEIDRQPHVFYFSGRRGWYVGPSQLTEKEIERLKTKGASYWVFTLEDSSHFKDRHPVHKYLARCYRTVIDTTDLVVFDLRSRRNDITDVGTSH